MLQRKVGKEEEGHRKYWVPGMLMLNFIIFLFLFVGERKKIKGVDEEEKKLI